METCSLTPQLEPAFLGIKPVPLESVITTDELKHRPSRPPDYEAENRALGALMDEMARATSADASATAVLQKLVETALVLCRADSAGVSLLEKEDGREIFRWRAVAGVWKQFIGGSMPREFSPCGTVLDRNTAILMEHPERHYVYAGDVPPLPEALLVPFHRNDKPIGTVWIISHDQTKKFDAEDLRLMTRLSRFAAAAHQLLVAQRLQEDLEDSRLLQAISAELIVEERVETLYKKLLDALVGIMHSDFASIQAFHPDGAGDDGELELLAFRDFTPEAAAFWKSVRFDSRNICGEALRQRRRIITPDIEQCEDVAGSGDRAMFRKIGIRAVQSTPLLSRSGKLVGMMSTHWRQPHQPKERELCLLDILARQAADLIERVQSERALHELQNRQAFLLKLNDALRSLSDPLAVQKGATRLLGEHLQVDRVGYAELLPDGVHMRTANGFLRPGVPSIAGEYRAVDFGDFFTDLRHKSIAILHDTMTDCSVESYEKTWGSIGVRAALACPLIKQGQMVATLYVHSIQPRRWSEDEAALVAEVAERTWEAVERARAHVALSVELDTVRKLEDRARENALWLKGQKEAFAAAMTDAPLATSLRPLIETAVQHFAGEARAGFYLANKENATLSHIVGMSEAYARAVEGFKIGADSLACGLAVHRGEPTITPDVMCDLIWEPWRWMAQEHNYRACWSFPVRTADGPVLGTLALYFEEPREATARDRELAGVLTHAATIIISRHQQMLERARSQQALRDSEERFRMMADNISQLAWTCDKLGNVTWYNQRWLSYTGRTFEEMRDWGWTAVHHPDHVDRVVASVTRSRESGEPWEDTFPLRGKDGEYRWFLSRAIPIRNENGEIVRWFGTNTDVTELRDAQQALREADRRKDEFLATLAHELRNPLAPVRNAIQLLRLTGKGTSNADWARDVIDRQIQQMSRLIDDLLDISRITRDKLELRREWIDLAKVVQAAVETSRPFIDEHRHELTVTFPPEPIIVDADPTRLAQVFANLLNNAAKYSDPEGTILVSVRREGDGVIVSVRDRGIGIAPDMLPRVFDLFSQAAHSPERGHSGLGIGLTLVKRLAEMHGGAVAASSEGIGKGSEFVVRLPVVLSASLTPPKADAPLAKAPSRRRVLVVDDNRDSATTLARLLNALGYETHEAHDGLAGLEALMTLRPDVALVDIGMPQMNGYELARHIRAQPWGMDPVLIAVTGWGQAEDKRHTIEAGFDHHLVKPVDPATLATLVAQLPTRKSRTA